MTQFYIPADDITFRVEQAITEYQDTIRTLRAALANVARHLTMCPYCHTIRYGGVIQHKPECELGELIKETQ